MFSFLTRALVCVLLGGSAQAAEPARAAHPAPPTPPAALLASTASQAASVPVHAGLSPSGGAEAGRQAVKPGAERQDIRAQLSPQRYTTLAAEIGAKISRLPVSEGGAFKSGQALIAFDCTLQAAQLNKARAALSGAEKTNAVNQRLTELGSTGKAELAVSESEVAKNRAEVAAVAAVLSKCSVAAPFAGRVSEQKVREQQYVQPGQALLEIIDDSVLELEFIAPSRWLAWLRAGHVFQVRIDETGKPYPAKVIRIGAKVDPVSQSVKLAAAIDGRFPELIAGMSGTVLLAPPSGQSQ